MSSYSKIKKLDEESLKRLTEGEGPIDECLCSLLAPDEKRGFTASLKKAFGSIGTSRGKRKQSNLQGHNSIEIPLSFTKGGKGVYTTKEVVQRKSSCGKCGCDKEKFVLKHSYANIRITSPDVSSICSCPSNCLPNKDKLENNIKITIERVTVDPGSIDYDSKYLENQEAESVDENCTRPGV